MGFLRGILMILSIDGKPLDDPNRTYIIAEMSGNHTGDYKKAVALIEAAAEAGADAVKVQTFTADEIAADIPFPYGHDAAHDAWARGLGVVGLRDLFKLGGLPRDWHKPLKAVAESLGLAFLSTPFSVDGARFLVEEVRVPALKIASGDLTFQPLLEYVTPLSIPVIMSTGGATFTEVYAIFDNVRLREHLAMLHCCAVYPAGEDMVNLAAIRTMHCFGCPVGFSDHTLSVDVVPVLAIACGSTVYEKHLTIDRSAGGIDSAHSLEPHEFKRMVEVIRRVPLILGDGVKKPHAKEMHDRLWARRSPVDNKRPTEAARQGQWE